METINIVQVCLEIWGALFCGISGLLVAFGKGKEKTSGNFLNAVLFINTFLLVFDSLAYIYRGNVTPMGFAMTRISNFLVYVLEYVLLSFASEFFHQIIKEAGGEQSHSWVTTIHILSTIGIMMIVISQFTGIYYDFDATNHYYRNVGWYYGTIIMYSAFAICSYEIVRNRNVLSMREKRGMFAYIILPSIAFLAQMFMYGLSLINIGITAAILMLYFTYNIQQVHNYAQLQVEFSEQQAEVERQKAEVERQKAEVVNSQMNLLLGQMQPHFVYNSLATIRSLCQENPNLAVETIDHFSSYLRGSLSIMDGTNLVAFSAELHLINDYLYMEKQRFGDKITVHEKIETRSFKVPPLSIQTLVENAIRHGIRGKNEPGNLWISTDHKDKKTYIIIEDDGVGFDTNVPPKNDGRHHIGMASTRKRIETLLHGSFEIRSEVGQGTRIVIIIPDDPSEERSSL